MQPQVQGQPQGAQMQPQNMQAQQPQAAQAMQANMQQPHMQQPQMHQQQMQQRMRAAPQANGQAMAGGNAKSKVVVAILCGFFGVLGVHRFYTGRWKSGLIQLFTVGGFFIWAFVDFIRILTGSFTDATGQTLT
jgi:membrane protein insertase Oxa1/YidC/SpoIIIJ